MATQSFMDRIRTFFGFHQPPRNDFRNPIWGSDDDYDYDDELYDERHRNRMYNDPGEFHRELTRHMDEMFKSFGGMSGIFGDMKMFFPEGQFSFSENFEPNNLEGSIRDYYLKPGYYNNRQDENIQDNDLDGQVSSNEIAGFLKRNNPDSNIKTITPFEDGNSSRNSFFQTIITSSIRKPDGSVETRRIVKDQNGVVEETTTQTAPSPRSPTNTNMDVFSTDVFNFAPNFSSIWRLFN